MGVKGTPIDTRGYQSLLSLVDNTTHDSFELYYGLFMYNQVQRHAPLPGCRLQAGCLLAEHAVQGIKLLREPE